MYIDIDYRHNYIVQLITDRSSSMANGLHCLHNVWDFWALFD